jgi:hypothetical protein
LGHRGELSVPELRSDVRANAVHDYFSVGHRQSRQGQELAAIRFPVWHG